MINILVVDDKKSMRDMLTMMIEEKGYHSFSASSGKEAVKILKKNVIHILITDLKMPNMTGLELLENMMNISPLTCAIMITAYGTVQDAVDAMKVGAVDFIQKPFSLSDMEEKIEKIIHERNFDSKRKRIKMGDIVGASKTTQMLYNMIEKVASTPATVLITGESGTGKELVAREIHKRSDRKDQPFVALNCGAVVESLLEDELFGHEKGAFTGAHSQKKGRFEIAHLGTLFLDEIAELPLNLQVKLLRVLQEMTLERVGGTKPIKVDVRIIAATNKDLKKLIKENLFREDLYYRFNVVNLKLAPLREREEDIPVIAQYFLARYGKQFNKKLTFTEEVLEIFSLYDWPGNVRQLRNVIERGVILVEDNTFSITELPPEMLSVMGKKKEKEIKTKKNILAQLSEIEKEAIESMLLKHNWNQTRAAKELGMGRTVLQYKMKKYGLYK